MAPLLKKAKYIFYAGSKDRREVLIFQLSFSHLQYQIAQNIPSKKKKKQQTQMKRNAKSWPFTGICLEVTDFAAGTNIWYYHCPMGCWIWLSRMLSQSFLFAILLQRLDIFQKRELKRRLKEDQWLSGKIIISSSRQHTAYWKAISEVPSMGSTLPLSSPPVPFQLVFNPPKPHICTDS